MRLGDERIKELRALLEEKSGLVYNDEQAQEAGLAIMRFVAAKAQRGTELIDTKEFEDGQIFRNNESFE